MAREADKMMEGLLQIDEIKIEPGEKVCTWLKVAEDVLSPIKIPFLAINGARPGKCLYVASGLNGDNYSGMEAIFTLFRQLNPGGLRGRLLAIPMLNAPAFERISRAGPDGLMFNRVSGGKKEGFLTERIAYFVLERVIRQADHALEMITGTHYIMTPFVSLVKQGEDYSEAYMEYARAFGCDLLWTGAASPAVFRNAVARRGVNIIMTEVAGEGYRQKESIDYEVRGIKNLLRHLGILEGEPENLPSRYLFFDNFWMHSQNGGIFRTDLKLRQRVRKGEVLGRIYNLLDEEIETIRAPHDGIIIGYRSLPRIYPGDWTVWVGNISQS